MRKSWLFIFLFFLAACAPAAPPPPGYNASMWPSHRLTEMPGRGFTVLPLAGGPYLLGTDLLLAEGFEYAPGLAGTNTGTLKVAGFEFLIEVKDGVLTLRESKPGAPTYSASRQHPVMEILIEGQAYFSLGLKISQINSITSFEMYVYKQKSQ